jgi:small subunit ribosomal protein S20
VKFWRNTLANIKSSSKRARQNITRRSRNRHYSSSARTYIKKARVQLAAGDLETAEVSIYQASKALDKAAQKGVIHKNNAARRKSNLVKALNKAKAAEA